MDTDWNGYSSDESGNSSVGSQKSGVISDSEYDTRARTLTCDADGKVLCTCGCECRRSPWTVYRHLRNARLRRRKTNKKSSSTSSNAPGDMDDLEMLENNGGADGQMHEAEDQELPGESDEYT